MCLAFCLPQTHLLTGLLKNTAETLLLYGILVFKFKDKNILRVPTIDRT